MKRLVMGLVFLGAIAGCSSIPAKEIPSPAATIQSVQETSYLKTLRTRYPEYNSVEDSLLISSAKNVCFKLDQGTPVVQVVLVPVDPPLTPAMWAYSVGVAIGTFCPAHAKDITELQQSLGG